MSNNIYYNSDLRCKIKYVSYLNHYHLQLQKKFLFFWIDVYKWMTVSEGFWGESDRHPILRDTYMYGNECEVYKTGSLDLKKRAIEFCEEYLEKEAEKNSRKNMLSDL